MHRVLERKMPCPSKVPHSQSLCNLNTVVESHATLRPSKILCPIGSAYNTRRYSEIPGIARLETGFTVKENNDLGVQQPKLPQGSFASHTEQRSSGQKRSIPCLMSRCESDPSSPTHNPDTPDSDATSSVYDFTIYDFPDPPPIGSPVIRRMCSSPRFITDENNDNSPRTSDRRVHSFMTESRRQNKNILSGAPLYDDVFGTDCNPFTGGFFDEGCERNLVSYTPTEDLSTSSRASALSIRCERSLTLNNSVKQGGSKTPFEEGEPSQPYRLPHLPRIIRKIASMQSNSRRHYTPDPLPIERKVPRMRSFIEGSGVKGNQGSWFTPPEKSFCTTQKQGDQQPPQKRTTEFRPQVEERSRWQRPKRISASLEVDELRQAKAPSENKSFLDFGPSLNRNAGRTNGTVKALLSRATRLFGRNRQQPGKEMPVE